MRYSHSKLVQLVSGLTVVIFVLQFTSMRLPLDYERITLRGNKCALDVDRTITYVSLARNRIKDTKVEKLIDIIQNETLLDVESLRTANFIDLAKSLGREKRNSAPYTNKSLIHTVLDNFPGTLDVIGRLKFRDVVLKSARLNDKVENAGYSLCFDGWYFFCMHRSFEHNRTETPNHLLFHYGIQKYSLYNPDDPAIDRLLHDLATLEITTSQMMESGSELKLLIGFIDNGMAVLKAMRNKREYETSPDQYHFEDFERHNAEIAAFHLSKTLGFYMVPPVSGRVIDLTTEIRPLAEPGLNDTFYVSPAGNLCFWGRCNEYCDPRHSFCGNGSKIEVSMMAFLPPYSFLLRSHPRNPYANTYDRWNAPKFERYANYCMGHVFGVKPVETMEKLLNLVDLHIFDFVQGNRDRHTLNYFKDVGLDGFLNVIDNGRAFGKTKIDEDSILAPLLQCCKIRESTFKKFISLYIGPRPLSDYFDQSMKSDPLYPILVDGHLTAVDRRATRVLRAVIECLENGYTLKDIVVSIE